MRKPGPFRATVRPKATPPKPAPTHRGSAFLPGTAMRSNGVYFLPRESALRLGVGWRPFVRAKGVGDRNGVTVARSVYDVDTGERLGGFVQVGARARLHDLARSALSRVAR